MKKKKWLSLFGYPKSIIQIVILTVANVLVIGIGTLYFSHFTDSIMGSNIVPSVVWKGLVGYVLFECLMMGTNYLYQIGSAKIKSNVTTKIRNHMFDVIYSTITPAMYTAQTKDKISSILINDLRTIRDKYVGNQIATIRIVLRFIIFLGILFYYSLLLGLWITFVIALLFVFSMISSRIVQKWGTINAQAKEQYLKDYQDYIYSRPDYKYVGKDEKLREKMLGTNRFLEHVTFQFGNTQIHVSTLNTAVRNLARCSVILLELILAASNSLTVGSIIATLSIISLLEDEIAASQTVIESFSETKGIREKVYQSFQSDSSILPQKSPAHWNKFGLKNVSFGYTEEKVLRNINLVFERGKKYLLCGKSGCGKSTVLRLLLGINTNYSGTIFVDDVMLPQGSEYLQLIAAYLKQDFHLFHDSIENNMFFENETFKSNLDHSGFNTILNRYIPDRSKIVEDDGCNLSGGQRQVIGIARALACGKQVLILDESFSALDKALYEEILSYLKCKEGLTLIVISHRYHNMHGFDAVYVLEKGEAYVQQIQNNC